MKITNEDQLQAECVSQFRDKYPEKRNLLFMVHNNSANAVIASKKLAMGMVAGVADLFHVESGCFIELKLTGEKHRTVKLIRQLRWGESVEASSPLKYRICRSVDEFWSQVEFGWGGLSAPQFREMYDLSKSSVVI